MQKRTVQQPCSGTEYDSDFEEGRGNYSFMYGYVWFRWVRKRWLAKDIVRQVGRYFVCMYIYPWFAKESRLSRDSRTTYLTLTLIPILLCKSGLLVTD